MILSPRLCACLAAAALLGGCMLAPAPAAKTAPEPAQGVAVEVSRVPLEREPLPLPELPEPLITYTPAPTDTAQDLATKTDLQRLAAQIEQAQADAAAAIYKATQTARAELENAQKKTDVELAALEARLAAQTATETADAQAQIYDANKWLGAIVIAAVAAIVYAYKRLSVGAACVALAGFAALFALVLAGKHYPRLVALAPLPLLVLVAYTAWREGIVRDALRACVRGVELADNDTVKQAISKQDKKGAIERAARKDIDAATADLARERLQAQTAARRGAEKKEKEA
ncbi:MAG: hypothetical protein J6P03_08535 [Opitutales bacterium]|nr:hypothetical protein [Opitutales bacterium]